MHTLIFGDPVFYRRYIEALEQVSDPSYVDELVSEMRLELQVQLAILHREWPEQKFSTRTPKHNADIIRAILRPKKALHAYLVSRGEESVEVELGAIQPMPVEVLSLSHGDLRFVTPSRVRLPGMPASFQSVPSLTRTNAATASGMAST